MTSRQGIRQPSTSHRAPNGTANAASSAIPTSASSTTGSLLIPPRRHHLNTSSNGTSRRAPGAASTHALPSTLSAISANEARPHHRTVELPAPTDSDSDSDSGGIIVTDERGEWRTDNLVLVATPLPRDDAREEREMESRLIESYRKHHEQIEPAELRATLQASLVAKAASLDEDAWMFEGGDGDASQAV